MNRGRILHALLPCALLLGAGQHGIAASLQFTLMPGLYNGDFPLFNATLVNGSGIDVETTQTGFSMSGALNVSADADGGLGLDLFLVRPAVADPAGTYHISGDITYSIWSNLEGTTASLTADGVSDGIHTFLTGYRAWSDQADVGQINSPEPIPFDSQTEDYSVPDDAFTFSSELEGYPLPFGSQTQLGEEFVVGIDGATAGETFRITLNESMSVDEAADAPEPATPALMGLGLLAFGSARFSNRAAQNRAVSKSLETSCGHSVFSSGAQENPSGTRLSN